MLPILHVLRTPQLSGQLPDDCAAKNLLVDTVANASNPSYMEDVVRAALGTMYGGESSLCQHFIDDRALRC